MITPNYIYSYLSRLPDHDQIDFAMMSAIMMQEKLLTQAAEGSPAANQGTGAASSRAAAEPLPPHSTDKDKSN
jgi:hypothetical protein